MKAILYVGHGTRSKTGAAEARSFVQRVMERIHLPIQELAFLELTEPSIAEGFARCIEKGATQISVVPLFLLAAGHIKEDIPQALAALKNTYPTVKVQVKDPFGIQSGLLDGLAELIRESAGDISRSDSILIVGRGSSDADLHPAFSKIAEGIRERLGTASVSVCYLAAASPRFDDGLRVIAEQTSGRVIVVPYLLFSGLLLAEVNQKVHQMQKQGIEILHTGQLSKHHSIEDIIIKRASQ
ncbi:sirohydrochlorin chelatase [Neobacillus niacini]|uniref:sirohydrochlorin chelatase n=1 Tax=Neobacillus niacini TaxID=86668 RepID=UPI0021CB8A63|nr:sirohydrochlorin chelatase [Neobacillus niacini]MCM3765495.1 sirohydrochlorin chelatase [Neobacillus niacini]